jgi:hypothetical protein
MTYYSTWGAQVLTFTEPRSTEVRKQVCASSYIFDMYEPAVYLGLVISEVAQGSRFSAIIWPKQLPEAPIAGEPMRTLGDLSTGMPVSWPLTSHAPLA